MRVYRELLVGVCLALLLGVSAKADLITGSLPLAGIGASQNGEDLSTSTTITAISNVTTNTGDADFSPVPLLTSFDSGSIDLTSAGSGFGYSLSNVDWGTFNPTSGSIVQQSPEFLDLKMVGVFSPGPSLSGFDPTPAILRISINQSGSSLSEAITLSAVPEPSSIALVLCSLVGIVFWRRRT